MKKQIIAGLLIVCMTLTGCSREADEMTMDIDSVKLKSNQEIVIAKITQIAGNEITYTVAEEVDTSQMQEKWSGSDRQKQSSSEMQAPPEDGENSQKGQAPSDDGTENSQKGQAPSGSSTEKSSEKQQTMYTLTDETATRTIPVGTAVITSLGNQTTFSRLSNGDVIKMILEKDSDGNKVIVGVWMM